MTETRKDGTLTTEPQPARGYRWEDAKPGNTLAVRHGAKSERLVSERAQAVMAEMIETWPWLSSADAIALDVLVKAKVRLDALDEYITGVIDGSVKPYPLKGRPEGGVEAVPDRVWQQVSREARTVLDASSKLGFTPVDRAQLLKDAGMARHFGGDQIAQLVETGRKLRLAGGNGA